MSADSIFYVVRVCSVSADKVQTTVSADKTVCVRVTLVLILNLCGKRFEINIKKEKQFYSHFIMVEYRMTLVVKS